MDKDLKEIIKQVLLDYLDNGLQVSVNLTMADSVGMAMRSDLIEKAISDGLNGIADSICSSITGEITVYQGDDT